MSFISNYVIIKNNKIWKDDKIFFEAEKDLTFGKFAKSIYKQLNMKYMKFFKMDEMSKLGILATEILVGERKLTEEYSAEEIGIIISNSSSSLFTDKKYNDTIKDNENYFPSPALFVYTLPNIVMGEIAIKNGFKGENIFYVQKEFAPEQHIRHSEKLLKRKSQKAMICGWIEVNETGYDCFLYLVEEKETGLAFDHNDINISLLYNTIIG
jgi:3-oxoacyl-(acyl-carrier-protein) synthase